MRYLISIIFIISLSLSAFSQRSDTSNYYFTGLQAQYGFIIPHTSKVEPVSHTRPFGFEISFNKLSTSLKSWHVFNRYSVSGIQLSYYNFQNPILGSAFVCSIFTEPILGFGKKWIFSVKAGTGLSYQSRIYDPDKNPGNTFFSTRISIPLYLMARFKYKLSANSYFTITGSYNHISNGAINLPNYGMNFPTLLVGIEHFQKPSPRLGREFKPAGSRKLHEMYLVVQTSAGYKIVYHEPVYAFGLNTRFTWQIRSHYALNAGAEIILDGGVRRNIIIENLEVDYKRAAVTAGQDFLFGRVIFTTCFGYYIYSPYKARNSLYQKYELSYEILPELRAGVFLKAHASDAELCGITFNYIIHYN